MIRNLLVWLTQDAACPKHTRSWKHPIAACLIHYALSSLMIVAVHDGILLRFFDNEYDKVPTLGTISLCPAASSNIPTKKYMWVATISFAYAMLLLCIRLVSNRPGVRRYSILYEFTWLCNAALMFGGSFGFMTCRPRIATGFAVAVSVDQILWYVDAIGYGLNVAMGKQKKKMFPIGVCQYLIWKQTNWSVRLTCTHHFWTIPLFIYGAGGLDWGSYLMNIVIVSSYVMLSRWLTPFGLNPQRFASDKKKQQQFEKYMNINLSHELWQDIEIGFLRRQVDDQSTGVYLVRLIMWWQLFNLLSFLLLQGVVRMIS